MEAFAFLCSKEYERIKMPSLSVQRHERERWSYMSISKLRSRLKRMTKLDKLEAFLIEARRLAGSSWSSDYWSLYSDCLVRLLELGRYSGISLVSLYLTDLPEARRNNFPVAVARAGVVLPDRIRRRLNELSSTPTIDDSPISARRRERRPSADFSSLSTFETDAQQDIREVKESIKEEIKKKEWKGRLLRF